jgi:hypothetical protein
MRLEAWVSTRALVNIIDVYGGKEHHMATVYVHMDGYPTGLGAILVDWMKKRILVNGLTVSTDGSVSDKENADHDNSFEETAVKLIRDLKIEHPNGDVYMSLKDADAGQEWEYDVVGIDDGENKGLMIRVYRSWPKKHLVNKQSVKDIEDVMKWAESVEAQGEPLT